MGKCAGQGHDPAGFNATSQGALSIPCRACLLLKINLPSNWHMAPETTQ